MSTLEALNQRAKTNNEAKVRAARDLAAWRLAFYELTVGQDIRYPRSGRRRTRAGRVLDVEPDGSIRIADSTTHAVHSVPHDRLDTSPRRVR